MEYKEGKREVEKMRTRNERENEGGREEGKGNE